ncbi:MAG: hypothetical protein GX577_16215 [Leptolinea sp.]|nr:hypothetical protein [Leptolinea sp.]
MNNREENLSDFEYRKTGEGKVLLYWKGKLIKTLSGTAAAQFLDKMEQADLESARLLIAKATGNFKRGNERHSPSSD